MNKPEIIDRLIRLLIENQRIAKSKQNNGELDNSAYAWHTGYEQAIRDTIKDIQTCEERITECTT